MFGKKKETVVVQPVEVVVEEVKPVITNTTIISSGATMVGDFVTSDPMTVCGTIQGNIESSNSVNISETGLVNGNAVAQNLDVEGTLTGDVKCSDKTRIQSKGSITGSLQTARLATDDGSSFAGKLSMVKPGAPALPEAEETVEKKPEE